jgi:hypothetical protein
LLPLNDARIAKPLAFVIGSQHERAVVVERESEGSVGRRKRPLRLNANPLHRKAKRALRAFS